MNSPHFYYKWIGFMLATPPWCVHFWGFPELCRREWGGLWGKWLNSSDVALSPPFVKREYNTWLCQEEEAAWKQLTSSTILRLSLKVSPLVTNVWPNNKQREPICSLMEGEVVQGGDISSIKKDKHKAFLCKNKIMNKTSKNRNTVYDQPPAVQQIGTDCLPLLNIL